MTSSSKRRKVPSYCNPFVFKTHRKKHGDDVNNLTVSLPSRRTAASGVVRRGGGRGNRATTKKTANNTSNTSRGFYECCWGRTCLRGHRHERHHDNDNIHGNTISMKYTAESSSPPSEVLLLDDDNALLPDPSIFYNSMSLPTYAKNARFLQFEKPPDSNLVVLLEPTPDLAHQRNGFSEDIKEQNNDNSDKENHYSSSSSSNEINSIRFVVVEETVENEESDNMNDAIKVVDRPNVNHKDTTACTTCVSPFSPVEDVIRNTIMDLAGSSKEGHCLFYLTRLIRLLQKEAINNTGSEVFHCSVWMDPVSSTSSNKNTKKIDVVEEIDDDDVTSTPPSRRRRNPSFNMERATEENNNKNNSIIHIMVRSGLIPTLISVIGRHQEKYHVTILSLALRLLGILGEHSECNEIDIVENNGVQVVIRTLLQHTTTASICLEACSTLYKILHCLPATHQCQKIVLRHMLISTTNTTNTEGLASHELLTSTSAREPSSSSKLKLKKHHQRQYSEADVAAGPSEIVVVAPVPDCTAGIEVLRRVMLLHLKHPAIQQFALSVLCLFAVMIVARNPNPSKISSGAGKNDKNMTNNQESSHPSALFKCSSALSKLLVSSMEDPALMEVILQVMRRYGSTLFRQHDCAKFCGGGKSIGSNLHGKLLPLNYGQHQSHPQYVIQSSVLQLGNKLLHCLLLANKRRRRAVSNNISRNKSDIGRYYYGRKTSTVDEEKNDGYYNHSGPKSNQLILYLLRSRCPVLLLQMIQRHHQLITKGMKLYQSNDDGREEEEEEDLGYKKKRNDDPLLLALYKNDLSVMKQCFDSLQVLAECDSCEVKKQLLESSVEVSTTTSTTTFKRRNGTTPKSKALGITTQRWNLSSNSTDDATATAAASSSSGGKTKETSGLVLVQDIAFGDNPYDSMGVRQKATKLLNWIERKSLSRTQQK